MDPALIPQFVAPILQGRADYVEGNRFYNIEDVQAMPMVRLIGNAVLSFMTKLSSGYWNIFDPTNGYTAVSATIVPYLPLHNISADTSSDLTSCFASAPSRPLFSICRWPRSMPTRRAG